MKRLGLLGMAIASASATLLALAWGPAHGQAPKAAIPTSPPGEGAICAWAIMTAMAEVGDRCFPGEDPDYQRELHAAVGHLDAYVLKNSKATQVDVEKFKREQGHVGVPTEQLCRGDGMEMYRSLHKSGAPAIRAIVAGTTARDGEPTWGTCL